MMSLSGCNPIIIQRRSVYKCIHAYSVAVVSDSLRTHSLWSARLLCLQDFSGRNTGVGCHFLLQGIFLIQGWNPHLPFSCTGRQFSITEPPGKSILNRVWAFSIYNFIHIWQAKVQMWKQHISKYADRELETHLRFLRSDSGSERGRLRSSLLYLEHVSLLCFIKYCASKYNFFWERIPPLSHIKQ